jgi:hypothetical protein
MNDIDERYLELIDKVRNLGDDEEIPADLLDNLTQREMVAIFVEQMLMEKGVAEPTNVMRIELIDAINGAIIKNVVAALPMETLEKYSGKFESMSDEELENVVKESGIDVDGITEKTMIDFREQYLNGGEQ